MITNEIVNKAISYIMEHIEENISLEDVADYCHFSKYYFCRVFKEETGESVYGFIQKVKLEQSAFRLKVDQDKTITDIGYDYGYSPSNYSSAFRKYHDESPAAFRKTIQKRVITHPSYPNAAKEIETFEEISKKVSIENLDPQRVLYERRIGSYYDLKVDWENFCKRHKQYINKDTIFYERTFDDPTITDTDKCLYDICISAPPDCELENTCMLDGGKFAVYHFNGQPEQIYSAYQSMFNIYIPQSGLTIDKRFGYDRYQEINCDTMNLTIDICIPVE